MQHLPASRHATMAWTARVTEGGLVTAAVVVAVITAATLAYVWLFT